MLVKERFVFEVIVEKLGPVPDTYVYTLKIKNWKGKLSFLCKNGSAPSAKRRGLNKD